jgi:hypothetical protein
MKVMLHLREGVSPARFLTDLRVRIRSGEIGRAWEVTRSKPSTVIRRVGRFKTSPVTLKPAPKRLTASDHRPPDIVASLSGKDAVLVLRYLVYLLASKLGDQVEGFYVPHDDA